MSKQLRNLSPWVAVLGVVLMAGCNPKQADESTASQRGSTPMAQDERRESSPMGMGQAGPVSDAAVTAAVKAELAKDPQLAAVKIDVNSTGGVVTLSGRVPDNHFLDHAVQVAMRTQGVVRVDSQLATEDKS